MNKTGSLLVAFLLCFTSLFAQDSNQVYKWTVSSKKIGASDYELIFSTPGNPKWQLYAPNQNPGDVPTTELQFADSTFTTNNTFRDSGSARTQQSEIFSVPLRIYEGPATFISRVH